MTELPDDPLQLAAMFAESLMKQEEAVLTGSKKEAVYQGKRRVPIARKIMLLGDSAKEQFAALLDHPERIVRISAAVYLFTSMPERVLGVLRDIAEGDDFVAYCAGMRIKEWEEHPEHYHESRWV